MNESLTLPFFTGGSSSYPPTPPFPDNFDSGFTSSQDDFASYSNGYDLDADGVEGDTASGLVLNGGGAHSHLGDGSSRSRNGASEARARGVRSDAQG